MFLKVKSAVSGLLILAFANLTACSYKIVKETAPIEVSKEKAGTRSMFKIVKRPSVEDPVFMLRYGEASVFRKTSKSTRHLEANTKAAQAVFGGIMIAGIPLLIAGAPKNEDEQQELGGVGIKPIGYYGIGLMLGGFFPWAIAYSKDGKVKETQHQESVTIVDSTAGFLPLGGEGIRVLASGGKARVMTTNTDGTFSIALPEFISEQSSRKSLQLTVQGGKGAVKRLLVSSQFLAMYDEHVKSLRPVVLVLKPDFVDHGKVTYNKLLDGGEENEIIVTVVNESDGKAFDCELIVRHDNPHIKLPSRKFVGDLAPGHEKKVSIPVSAKINVPNGKATVTIQLHEPRRGYRSQPVDLTFQVKAFRKPRLEVTSVEINDSELGNGNGIPENGETVELVFHLKNVGVGKSINTTATLSNLSSELKVIGDFDGFGTMPPGQVARGKVAIHIPETYGSNKIACTLHFQDEFASTVLTVPYETKVGLRKPQITYRLTGPKEVYNGGSFDYTLIPENTGQFAASDVSVHVSCVEDLIAIEDERFHINRIPANGTSSPRSFTLIIPRRFKRDQVNITVDTKERSFGLFTWRKTIPVEIHKPSLELSDLSHSLVGGKLVQGEAASLQFKVTNSGDLDANDVRLKFNSDLFSEEMQLHSVKAQTSRTVDLPVEVGWQASVGPLQIMVSVSQEDFPGISKTFDYYIEVGSEQSYDVKPLTATASKDLAFIGKDTAPVIDVNLEEGAIVSTEFNLVANFADDQQLREAQIKLNDVLIYDSKADMDGQRQLSRTGHRMLTASPKLTSLLEGKNVLKIKAFDNLNEVSSMTIEFSYQPGEEIAPDIVLDYSIDIERDIPKFSKQNDNAIAVVLGVEDYRNLPDATFANRDAAVFKKYAVNVLGVPDDSDHMFFGIDDRVTLGLLLTLFSDGGWLDRKVTQQSDVYVYFAGHGLPDFSAKGEGTPVYLMAYDGDAEFPGQTGLERNRIYEKLASIEARSVTVFIDVCFSGLTRENNSIRPGTRLVVPNIGNPIFKSDKLIVFTASTGAQISSAYPEKRHGLFTYFVLKGLRGEADSNTDKKITAQELQDYLSANVGKVARSLGREQKPGLFGRNKQMTVIAYD